MESKYDRGHYLKNFHDLGQNIGCVESQIVVKRSTLVVRQEKKMEKLNEWTDYDRLVITITYDKEKSIVIHLH